MTKNFFVILQKKFKFKRLIKSFVEKINPDSDRFVAFLQYADPVADLLDKQGVFTSRLFRESCVFHNGNYVKDLSLIGRDLNKVIIIDNSPASYIFHPDNAVRVYIEDDDDWFDCLWIKKHD